MQITLGSTITVEHPSIELVAWCKENLTITNPEYAQKMRMHLWLGNTPRYLALYETRGTTLILPFGALRRVMQFIGNADVQTDFPQGTAINYGCSVPLYDYQEEAVDAFYGYSTHKADADFLYGWYIVELTAKLNRVIQVLKEEADFGEFGSIFKIEPIIDTDLFGAPAGILNYPGIVKSYAPVPLAKAGVIANIVQEYGESYVHSFLRASDPGLLATTYRSNSVLNVYAEGLRTGAMNYDVPIETISRTALTPLVFVGYMRYITQSRTEIMATVDISNVRDIAGILVENSFNFGKLSRALSFPIIASGVGYSRVDGKAVLIESLPVMSTSHSLSFQSASPITLLPSSMMGRGEE